MRKIYALAAALAVGLGGMGVADAETIRLGLVAPGKTRYFGNTIDDEHEHFTDRVRFSLTGPSSITASFESFYNIVKTSFKVELEEKIHGSWVDIATGAPQSSSYSFALSLLQKGAYRWNVTGRTGDDGGFWSGKMSVAAVPEADVWTMLLIGAGLVGYQLRRKQNALHQLPFAG